MNTILDLENKICSLTHPEDGAVQQLEELEQPRQHAGKEIRIWMDGAFDMMHYGHMNAFRQGRSLGTHLVVGVNSDVTITACKGPPGNAQVQ